MLSLVKMLLSLAASRAAQALVPVQDSDKLGTSRFTRPHTGFRHTQGSKYLKNQWIAWLVQSYTWLKICDKSVKLRCSSKQRKPVQAKTFPRLIGAHGTVTFISSVCWLHFASLVTKRRVLVLHLASRSWQWPKINLKRKSNYTLAPQVQAQAHASVQK